MRLAVSGAQPLFTLGLLMFALSLVDFLSLLLNPSTYFKIFYFSKVSFEGHIQNLQKISCWFKIWMEFVGPILIKLWTSSIWGFLYLPLWWTLGNCKHAGHHSVTTGACNPPHLTCLGLCAMYVCLVHQQTQCWLQKLDKISSTCYDFEYRWVSARKT